MGGGSKTRQGIFKMHGEHFLAENKKMLKREEEKEEEEEEKGEEIQEWEYVKMTRS